SWPSSSRKSRSSPTGCCGRAGLCSSSSRAWWQWWSPTGAPPTPTVSASGSRKNRKSRSPYRPRGARCGAVGAADADGAVSVGEYGSDCCSQVAEPGAASSVVDGVGEQSDIAAGGRVEEQARSGGPVVVDEAVVGDLPGQAPGETVVHGLVGQPALPHETGELGRAVLARMPGQQFPGEDPQVDDGGEHSGVPRNPAHQGRVLVMDHTPGGGCSRDAAFRGRHRRAAR